MFGARFTVQFYGQRSVVSVHGTSCPTTTPELLRRTEYARDAFETTSHGSIVVFTGDGAGDAPLKLRLEDDGTCTIRTATDKHSQIRALRSRWRVHVHSAVCCPDASVDVPGSFREIGAGCGRPLLVLGARVNLPVADFTLRRFVRRLRRLRAQATFPMNLHV